MNFDREYTQILSLVKDDMKKVNEEIVDAISVAAPLNQELLEFFNAPSKRIRPLLALLYLKSADIEITERHYSLLGAIELIHNASLIHDDIIDECGIRRGRTAIHKSFGNKLAVISGDYILSLAMQKIAALNSAEILASFSNTMKNMCIGEINQQFNLFKIPTLEQYIEKSAQKTGNLFKSAIETSLILSGLDVFLGENFALNFGIAFQIRDDILNIISCEKFGKPINNDVECGIYNAPVIFAGGKENIMNGVEKTYILLNNYIDKSKKYLSNLEDNVYKEALVKLTEELINV